jgi:hypothetical protein
VLRATRDRRRRFEDRRPRWFQIPEDPDHEPNYDRDDMMVMVDGLGREWRDLVNEHGFTAVIKTRREVGADLQAATRMLRQRHDMRQRQLAEGMF